jgi:hypothetical protein
LSKASGYWSISGNLGIGGGLDMVKWRFRTGQKCYYIDYDESITEGIARRSLWGRIRDEEVYNVNDRAGRFRVLYRTRAEATEALKKMLRHEIDRLSGRLRELEEVVRRERNP